MPVNKPIRIIVNGGHVKLEGVVDSEADKNVAGSGQVCARDLLGDNNLQVVK